MDNRNSCYPQECVMPLPPNSKNDVDKIDLRFKTPEKRQGNMVNISISFDGEHCPHAHSERRIEPVHATNVAAKPPSPRVEIIREPVRVEPKVYQAEYIRPVMVSRQATIPEPRIREVPHKTEYRKEKLLHGYLVTPKEIPRTQAPVVHSEPPVRSHTNHQSRYLLLKVDDHISDHDHEHPYHSSVYQESRNSPRMEMVPSTRNHFFP